MKKSVRILCHEAAVTRETSAAASATCTATANIHLSLADLHQREIERLRPKA